MQLRSHALTYIRCAGLAMRSAAFHALCTVCGAHVPHCTALSKPGRDLQLARWGGYAARNACPTPLAGSSLASCPSPCKAGHVISPCQAYLLVWPDGLFLVCLDANPTSASRSLLERGHGAVLGSCWGALGAPCDVSVVSTQSALALALPCRLGVVLQRCRLTSGLAELDILCHWPTGVARWVIVVTPRWLSPCLL